MGSADILIIPDDSRGFVVPAELELDDLLTTSLSQMPVFIKGTVKLSLDQQLMLKMASKCRSSSTRRR